MQKHQSERLLTPYYTSGAGIDQYITRRNWQQAKYQMTSIDSYHQKPKSNLAKSKSKSYKSSSPSYEQIIMDYRKSHKDNCGRFKSPLYSNNFINSNTPKNFRRHYQKSFQLTGAANNNSQNNNQNASFSLQSYFKRSHSTKKLDSTSDNTCIDRLHSGATNYRKNKQKIYGIFDPSYIKFSHGENSKQNKQENILKISKQVYKKLTDQQLLKKYYKSKGILKSIHQKSKSKSKSKTKSKNGKSNKSKSPTQPNANIINSHNQSQMRNQASFRPTLVASSPISNQNQNIITKAIPVVFNQRLLNTNIPINSQIPVQIVKQIHHQPTVIHHHYKNEERRSEKIISSQNKSISMSLSSSTQNQKPKKPQILIEDLSSKENNTLLTISNVSQNQESNQKSPIKRIKFDHPEEISVSKKIIKLSQKEIKQCDKQLEQSICQGQSSKNCQTKSRHLIESNKFQSSIFKELFAAFQLCENQDQYIKQISKIMQKRHIFEKNTSENKQNESQLKPNAAQTMSTMLQTSSSFYSGMINTKSDKKKKGLQILLKHNYFQPYISLKQNNLSASQNIQAFCKNLLNF